MTIIKFPQVNNFPNKVERFKTLAKQAEQNLQIDLFHENPDIKDQ